ncbi:hypothetical protein BCF55_1709 [Hydrogenivirga caldilitoris]|uniref:Uncharacterized protein n=1 Tax=Hydrogenivirga caldilitoris TaxID=246264 RepID=A0A497XQY5_9AQUI|nr:DsrE family protein [Hydrogenivirga caldilitoris]RLJ71407.1 hypothetical protein BCF55_1709 [Hydrogenivirga caldilitoris]
MNKVAIVVLAGKETHESLGRVANALEAVKEFKEAGDEVVLIFDGAGTEWVGELSKEEHLLNPLYKAVKDRVKGVCSFCANAFGVKEEIERTGAPLLSEYDGHPSFKHLISEGYQVITF